MTLSRAQASSDIARWGLLLCALRHHIEAKSWVDGVAPMAAIDAHSLSPRPHPLSKLWAFFTRVKWLLPVVATLALTATRPIKCEDETLHSNLLPVLLAPVDVPIDTTVCRLKWAKDSPKIRIVHNNPPAVHIEW
jgi:hypothetical protein